MSTAENGGTNEATVRARPSRKKDPKNTPRTIMSSGVPVLCTSSAREARAPATAHSAASATNPATKKTRYHATGPVTAKISSEYSVRLRPTSPTTAYSAICTIARTVVATILPASSCRTGIDVAMISTTRDCFSSTTLFAMTYPKVSAAT